MKNIAFSRFHLRVKSTLHHSLSNLLFHIIHRIEMVDLHPMSSQGLMHGWRYN